MRYLTARKRAEGRGAAHTGTEHHWSMTVSSVGPALLLVVGMRHFAMGATMMIEDYARGTTRKMLIIFVISLAWIVAATGLFALARMAL
jgi:succinate dehydrogenase / fumarate reductase, membrane anchor subunit